MAEALKRPGGELASRPLHFFWVVDCSGSMYGEKIGTVNHAIQSTIPEMVDAAKDNPNAQLLVRTLKFSTGATWVTPDPVNIEDFAWDDLDAGGVTDLGKAFEMLAAQLTLDVVERVLDEVDKSRDVDWTILGERLRSAILDSGEHVDAGFTEAQKAAIVAVCRETYYATSVVARAYAFKAVEALLDRIGE